MARNRKTVRKGFEYRSCDDFAAYLNHMARQGWHFKEWRAGLVFARGEPEDSVYAVEVFSGAEEYDTRPEPKTREFAEYCEAAGWQFIDAMRKFCVFKRIRPDAAPIMTDAERMDAIARATQRDIWHPVIFSGLYSALRIMNFSVSLQRNLFSNIDLMFTAFFFLMLAASLLRCCQFYLWKFRCEKRLAEGKRLFFGKGRQTFSQGWYIWVDIALLLAMLLVTAQNGQAALALIPVIPVGIALLLGLMTAKKRPDAVTNQIQGVISGALVALLTICLGFFLVSKEVDEEKPLLQPPLTYEDMGVILKLEEVRSIRQDQSIFGTWHYANLDYGDDYLFYDIYTTKYHWVLDKVWDEETDGKANETREDCTDLWGAVEAFRNGAGDYLVRYEDAIWVISPSLEEPLTSEQIGLVIDAIRGG